MALFKSVISQGLKTMGDTRERHQDKEPNAQLMSSSYTADTSDNDTGSLGGGGSRNAQAEALTFEPSSTSNQSVQPGPSDASAPNQSMGPAAGASQPPEMVTICLEYAEKGDQAELESKIRSHYQRLEEAPKEFLPFEPIPPTECTADLEAYVETLQNQIVGITHGLQAIDTKHAELDQREQELQKELEGKGSKVEAAPPEVLAELEEHRNNILSQLDDIKTQRQELAEAETSLDTLTQETITLKHDVEAAIKKIQNPVGNTIDRTHEGPTIGKHNPNAVPPSPRMQSQLDDIGQQQLEGPLRPSEQLDPNLIAALKATQSFTKQTVKAAVCDPIEGIFTIANETLFITSRALGGQFDEELAKEFDKRWKKYQKLWDELTPEKVWEALSADGQKLAEQGDWAGFAGHIVGNGLGVLLDPSHGMGKAGAGARGLSKAPLVTRGAGLSDDAGKVLAKGSDDVAGAASKAKAPDASSGGKTPTGGKGGGGDGKPPKKKKKGKDPDPDSIARIVVGEVHRKQIPARGVAQAKPVQKAVTAFAGKKKGGAKIKEAKASHTKHQWQVDVTIDPPKGSKSKKKGSAEGGWVGYEGKDLAGDAWYARTSVDQGKTVHKDVVDDLQTALDTAVDNAMSSDSPPATEDLAGAVRPHLTKAAAKGRGKLLKNIELTVGKTKDGVIERDTIVFDYRIGPNADEGDLKSQFKVSDAQRRRYDTARGDSNFESKFTTAQWRTKFSQGDSQPRKDMRALKKVGLVTDWPDAKETYVLLPLTDTAKEQLIIERLNAAGRKHEALYDHTNDAPKPFGQPEVLEFLGSSLAKVPTGQDFSSAIMPALRGMTTELDSLGSNQWQFKGEPPERHVPKKWNSVTVRNRFYINGSGYKPTATKIRKAGVAKISTKLTQIEIAKAAGDFDQMVDIWQELYDVEKLICLGQTIDEHRANLPHVEGQMDAILNAPSVAQKQALWQTLASDNLVYDPAVNTESIFADINLLECDHKRSLIDHWVTEGFRSIWKTRQDFASDTNNLRAMHGSFNSSDDATSHGYHTIHAAPSFTGPGSTKGVWWADESTKFDNAP